MWLGPALWSPLLAPVVHHSLSQPGGHPQQYFKFQVQLLHLNIIYIIPPMSCLMFQNQKVNLVTFIQTTASVLHFFDINSLVSFLRFLIAARVRNLGKQENTFLPKSGFSSTKILSTTTPWHPLLTSMRFSFSYHPVLFVHFLASIVLRCHLFYRSLYSAHKF